MQEALLIKYYVEINKILGIFDIPSIIFAKSAGKCLDYR